MKRPTRRYSADQWPWFGYLKKEPSFQHVRCYFGGFKIKSMICLHHIGTF